MFLTTGSRAVLAGVATLLIVAGCAQSGGSSPSAAAGSPGTSAAASPAASPAGSPTAGEVYEVNVTTDATLGQYLTGEDGLSLYILTKDSAGTSTCDGTCAANWPPFILDEGDSAKAGAGVTATIGTFMRGDGTTQVTINGLPLYYFANDKAAGDTNGQGIGGVWYLASPAGTPAGSPPPGGYDY